MTSHADDDGADNDLYSEDFPEFRRAGGLVAVTLPINPPPEPEVQAANDDAHPEAASPPIDVQPAPKPLTDREIVAMYKSGIALNNRIAFGMAITTRELHFERAVREAFEGLGETQFAPPMAIRDLMNMHHRNPGLLIRYFQYERRVAAALIYLASQINSMPRPSGPFRNRYEEQQKNRMSYFKAFRGDLSYVISYLFDAILDTMFPDDDTTQGDVESDERLTLLDPHLVECIIKKNALLAHHGGKAQQGELNSAEHRFEGITKWTGE